MTILELIIAIVVVGLVLWIINTYVPMQPPLKTLLNVVIVLVLVFWAISALGLLGPLNHPVRVH